MGGPEKNLGGPISRPILEIMEQIRCLDPCFRGLDHNKTILKVITCVCGKHICKLVL